MDRIKVLGISGSPRKNGNTEILINKALEVCKENGADTSFISLAKKEINYCDGCYSCIRNSKCVHNDDAREILDEMVNADAIIIGSPTYFASMSGKLKSLLDRTFPLRVNGYKLSGKVGGVIAVGGSRNGGQEFVCREIQNWMLLHEMIVVADKKTAHFGGIAVGRRPGDVVDDETGIKTVENLALQVMETIKKIGKR